MWIDLRLSIHITRWATNQYLLVPQALQRGARSGSTGFKKNAQQFTTLTENNTNPTNRRIVLLTNPPPGNYTLVQYFLHLKDMAMGNTTKDKTKALELTVHAIEKQFGKGSIMRLGDAKSLLTPADTIPTGSLSLDIAMGIGGFPRGRIVEIYGPESSGKTTLTLHALANAQKQGGVAAFIDAEHALDVRYAKALGVNIDELLISQPDTGEQALEIADMLVRSNAIDILVIDSVAALTPRAEIEGEMGDSHMGLQARLMSQALRKLTGTISKSKTCMIFINQIRLKIGVMFGNPETTTGGNALKFYCSCRLDIRRIGAIKSATDVIGNRTRVKVVKNKLAPPFREAEFDIMYGTGISLPGDVLDLAAKHDIVEKSGSWYSYQNDRLGQGRENAKSHLMEHPELMAEIQDKVREKYGLIESASAPDEKSAALH
jgi:recombination protein RecA